MVIAWHNCQYHSQAAVYLTMLRVHARQLTARKAFSKCPKNWACTLLSSMDANSGPFIQILACLQPEGLASQGMHIKSSSLCTACSPVAVGNKTEDRMVMQKASHWHGIYCDLPEVLRNTLQWPGIHQHCNSNLELVQVCSDMWCCRCMLNYATRGLLKRDHWQSWSSEPGRPPAKLLLCGRMHGQPSPCSPST